MKFLDTDDSHTLCGIKKHFEDSDYKMYQNFIWNIQMNECSHGQECEDDSHVLQDKNTFFGGLLLTVHLRKNCGDYPDKYKIKPYFLQKIQ